MKLYRVNLRSYGRYSVHYAVAENSAAAHQQVREWLTREKLMFDKEREMQSVELLADTAKYADCEVVLHLPPEGGA